MTSYALGICDRCGWTWKLSRLRPEVQNRNRVDNRVCPHCYDPDHPQYRVSEIKELDDPKQLRDPRPDYYPVPDGSTDDRFHEFISSRHSWVAANDTVDSLSDGIWTLACDDGPNPVEIENEPVPSGLEMEASSHKYVRIRFQRVEANTSDSWAIRFRWKRDTDSLFSSARQVMLPDPEFPLGTQFSEVSYKISDHSLWNGEISSLNIRLQGHTDSSRPMKLDYIRITEF